MKTERLLFAAHEGTYRGRRAAVTMADHSLPIAVSASSELHPDGIHALWESLASVEEFFEALELDAVELPVGEPGGLYVYEVSYPDDLEIDDDDAWSHLAGGSIRRPLDIELSPLSRGAAPWEGGVLL